MASMSPWRISAGVGTAAILEFTFIDVYVHKPTHRNTQIINIMFGQLSLMHATDSSQPGFLISLIFQNVPSGQLLPECLHRKYAQEKPESHAPK